MRPLGSHVPPSLPYAIARAVREGRAAANQLEATFDQLQSRLDGAVRLVEPWREPCAEGTRTAGGMVSTFIERLTTRGAEMHQLFERQKEALGSVNLAFFGRTGAGKSSLIEALTHGDGESVSKTGESDWTTCVRPVPWQGCQLLDTPEINGWGRSEERSTLEDRARQAVQIADIVLLCFDTQSQQHPEFQKVADWIHAYGKPAIAILNCRNSWWRLPPRIPLASARRTVATQVRQHGA